MFQQVRDLLSLPKTNLHVHLEDTVRPQTAGQAHRWPLERPPLLLETSMPGVFAAGDVRHQSAKRVTTAIGEGALAIQLLHQHRQAEEDR